MLRANTVIGTHGSVGNRASAPQTMIRTRRSARGHARHGSRRTRRRCHQGNRESGQVESVRRGLVRCAPTAYPTDSRVHDCGGYRGQLGVFVLGERAEAAECLVRSNTAAGHQDSDRLVDHGTARPMRPATWRPGAGSGPEFARSGPRSPPVLRTTGPTARRGRRTHPWRARTRSSRPTPRPGSAAATTAHCGRPADSLAARIVATVDRHQVTQSASPRRLLPH